MRLFLLFLILVLTLQASAASANTVTIQLQDANTENLADTNVRKAFGDTNYGAAITTQIRDDILATNNPNRMYARFSLSQVPSGAIILDSQLFFYVSTAGTTTTANAYHQVNDTWGELTITWNNQPCPGTGCNATAESSNNSLNAVGWKSWNVTNMVANSTANGKDNVSIFLKTAETNVLTATVLYSKESTVDITLRPYLNITYETTVTTTNISACGSLNISGMIYNLTNDVSSTTTCFTVTGNNITFTGNNYTVNYSNQSASLGYAFTVDGYNNFSLNNTRIIQGSITGNAYAVVFNNSANHKVNYTTITTIGERAFPIRVNDVSGLILRSNNLNSTQTEAFFASSSEANKLMYDHNIDETNLAEGKPILYIYNASDQTIKNDSSLGQLYITASNNMTVTNITIINADNIGCSMCNNSNISYNNVSNYTSRAGIRLYPFCYNNIAKQNTLSSSTINNHGFYLDSGATDGQGISLDQPNTIDNNTISLSGWGAYGIYLYRINNITITSNKINTTGTDGNGYLLYYSNSSYSINNSINASGSTFLYGVYAIYMSPSWNGYFENDTLSGNYRDIRLIGTGHIFKNVVFNTIQFINNETLFNYSNASNYNIWLKTQMIVTPTQATTTTRALLNWTISNISWIDTWTATRQIQYNISGLSSNTDYQVYNDTNIDYNYTTDANGILTSFSINFTAATAKTIKILQAEAEAPVETFTQNIYNMGWQTVFINATQNMTSIRSMMNSSNVNWIARWNATNQKFETYKAGWSYRATNNASAGEAIYLKVTNNDTVTRNNGTANYNWTLSKNWNLIGLDYNGTRTLSQINTSVNSLGICEADLIYYIKPDTMTEYIYTCGSANNATIEVSQGQGFLGNATVAINRTRSW